ncbi:hypothetical protein ALQ37_02770 [Pseudomonas syringae pv. aptata]|uniref:Uncharacterized protein n=1 Tax=Pseudomonas syringae pv. aptata TaxID=83167 RepID=A0A3M3WJ56_PSEAP|nr:hypothetical protein ALQ37_02770 [Pseudomonas syringae pv. aptata]
MRKTLIALMFATALPTIAMAAPPPPPEVARMLTDLPCTWIAMTAALAHVWTAALAQWDRWVSWT